MMGFDAASVSDLVSSIKDVLEEQFQEVMVQGEVTNLSPSGAGHWYFTLSDENAALSCALFKGDALRNPLIRNLKDGDKIVIVGPISVYQKRGSFQLLAKRIFPAGEGQLKLQYERLKAKLSQEGFFDIEKKKEIPKFPKRIAVITAEHGAALQDFLNVMNRRSLWMDILIVPALVQGDGAPRSLVSALKKAQAISDVDVIVMTRGGGSMEDLWGFNDENLVRAIHDCPIPVISAVGHQVDFTLCDYVADHRSETPTAAAETLSQPQTELKARLTFCQTHLKSDLFKLYQHVQLMTQKFHPKELLALMKEKIQDAHMRLKSIHLSERASELIGLPEAEQRLDEAELKLLHNMQMKSATLTEKLNRFEHVLEALNPSKVLGRGYSYVTTKEGTVLTSLKDYSKATSGSKIEIQFHDGKGLAIKE
ncbi:exodeoxyribonuclease VII large subunit [Peredibacter starrii]|uniref:Exodeoxyribonuclease 7 large subunit n=1 Tax=Peredibacter starrii TaxID=28202 RepID=A0AAX4HMR5_9BACT|nr:exodeoxyribonuclease VII large subunit [Peredibacter starrii]WPU64448.1 exodeoxyribonuclease VII large subunit [Peredibacter starrii]